MSDNIEYEEFKKKIMGDYNSAMSVTAECAGVYFDYFKELPESTRKSISLYTLREIFKTMVVPAIDKARALDRNQD